MTSTEVATGTGDTRRAVHTLLELLMAGPQFATAGTIRLRVTDRTISTVAEPGVRLSDDGLSGPGGSVSWAEVTTAAAAAVGIGVDPSRAGIYHDTSGLGPDDLLVAAAGEVAGLLDWYQSGADALAAFAPDHQPVLWPEHADLAITVDEVNYGVSPGDEHHPLPYAYVGPFAVPDDPWFDQPFGALRTVEQVRDAAAVAAFFAEGRAAVARAAGAS